MVAMKIRSCVLVACMLVVPALARSGEVTVLGSGFENDDELSCKFATR